MTALATVSDVEAVTAQEVDIDSFGYAERLIELVSSAVVRYTGQSFTEVIDDSVVVTPHDGVLRLPQLPVTSVASVTVGTTLIVPEAYTVHSNGYLRRTLPFVLVADSQFGMNGITHQAGAQWPINGEFGWPPFPTTVVYTHGYPDGESPDDVALVVAEVVAAKLLGGERQANGVISEAIDTYKVQFYKNEPTGSWLPEHKQILDSYRRSKLASLRLG